MRWVLVSSPNDTKEAMASSCVRGGLDWIFRNIYLLKEWSDTGTGCPGKWLSHHLWIPGWTRGDTVWCVEQPRFRSGGEPWERLTRNPVGKAERRAWDTGAGGMSLFPATPSLPSCHAVVCCHSTVFTSRCSSAPITRSCSSFAYIWIGG